MAICENCKGCGDRPDMEAKHKIILRPYGSAVGMETFDLCDDCFCYVIKYGLMDTRSHTRAREVIDKIEQ